MPAPITNCRDASRKGHTIDILKRATDLGIDSKLTKRRIRLGLGTTWADILKTEGGRYLVSFAGRKAIWLCAEELFERMVSEERRNPLDVEQLAADAKVSGCVAIYEVRPCDYVPSKTDLSQRDEITRKLISTHRGCHTVISRIGCYLCVFRAGKHVGALPVYEDKSLIMDEWEQIKGFLLLWGSDTKPRSVLPSVLLAISWPEYRRLLIELIIRTTPVVWV